MNKFYCIVTTLLLNETLWFAAASHVTSFYQLKCFISAKDSFAALIFVYDIGSRSPHAAKLLIQ